MRREYKYLVDERTAADIRRWIAGVCLPDAHAGDTGHYLVDTLYLDTLDLRCYRATAENEARRYKLRIRTYPGAPVTFLEVKRRVDDVIIKARAELGESWRELLDTGDVTLVQPHQRGDAETFLANYHASGFGPMVPTVLIRYEREPYSSVIDNYARLTFDRAIRYQPASDLTLSGDENAWVAIDDPIAMRGPESFAILELKFEERAPGWMARMVKALELPRLAFSKYARAIESMTLRPGLREVGFG